MRRAIWLLILAIVIAGLLRTFHLGAILAFFGVFLLGDAVLTRKIGFRHVIPAARFVVDFAWDVIKSNLVMAFDAATLRDMHRVRLVEVPIGDMSDREIVLLNHRINLSPGTLVCRIDRKRGILVVHDMYGGGEKRPAELRAPIDLLRGGKPQ